MAYPKSANEIRPGDVLVLVCHESGDYTFDRYHAAYDALGLSGNKIVLVMRVLRTLDVKTEDEEASP